jgi:hypothetical protein
VSVHLNSTVRGGARGAETYFLSLQASDQRAAAAAEAENRSAATAPADTGTGELGTADETNYDLQLILWDLAQTQHLAASQRLATLIQAELNQQLDLKDRGVKQAPFRVLMGATMPAVLVELGFISTAEEEEKLRASAYRSALRRRWFEPSGGSRRRWRCSSAAPAARRRPSSSAGSVPCGVRRSGDSETAGEREPGPWAGGSRLCCWVRRSAFWSSGRLSPASPSTRQARQSAVAAPAESSADRCPVSLAVRLYFLQPRAPGARDARAGREARPRVGGRWCALAGPTAESLVAALPSEVALFRALVMPDGTAYLDLRGPDGGEPPASGSEMEMLRVFALVYSVVWNVPEAERVVLLWNGEQRPSFSGHVNTGSPLVANRQLLTPP